MPDEFLDELENDVDDDTDLLSDLLDDEIAAKEGSPKISEEEFNTLKAQVEALEKEKSGLLSATKNERQKRQQTAERLNHLEGAIEAILSTRQQRGMESVTETQAADAQKLGIPVTYDDDGNGWIDPSHVNKLVSPYEQRIMELEQKLQLTEANAQGRAEADRILDSIVGENEQYGPARGRYRAARKWVEDEVQRYTASNNINHDVTSGFALDRIFDAQLRKEFDEQFPQMSLMDVVTAEDSVDHFRRMLDNVVSTMESERSSQNTLPKEDSRFQKVLNKPSSLGNQANAKAGQLSILERVGNLRTEDIMNLSDDQIDTLMDEVGRD